MRQLLWLLVALTTAPSVVEAQTIQLDRPLAELQAIAQQDSNDAAAHYNLAVGYLAQHQYDHAESALQTALAIEPRFAEAWLALSVVHDRDEGFWKRLRKDRGDSGVRRTAEEYGRYYRRAFVINPLVDMRILGSTMRVYGSDDWIKGLKALVEGRYPDAFDHFDHAARYAGDAYGARYSDAMHWLRAMAAARAGKADVAVSDLDSLLEHVAARKSNPDTTEFDELDTAEMRQVIAELQRRNGHEDEAIGLYREALSADLGNYMAHVHLADIYEGRHDYAQALTERRRAMETNPDDASLGLDLGITLGKSGDFAGAVTALRTASERSPRDTRSLFWLGLAEQQAGHADAARDAYTRFVALAPSRFEKQKQVARQHLGQLQ